MVWRSTEPLACVLMRTNMPCVPAAVVVSQAPASDPGCVTGRCPWITPGRRAAARTGRNSIRIGTAPTFRTTWPAHSGAFSLDGTVALVVCDQPEKHVTFCVVDRLRGCGIDQAAAEDRKSV